MNIDSDLVTLIISWCAGATSLVAVGIANKNSDSERAHVVVSQCTTVSGGIETVLINVGGQGAIDVSVALDGNRAGFTGGIAAGQQLRLVTTLPARDEAVITVEYSAQGKPRTIAYQIEKSSSGWSLSKK